MMDCGRKTLIVLILCALVGANEVQQLVTILDILVSVPSTHMGDTEIASAVLNATAAHPFRYTVIAQKNQTKCINSTDPLCPSLIQPPALIVSVSSRASNGENVTYSISINGSLELAVHVGPKVSVRPQLMSGGSDAITVLLDITYNENTTRRGSFTSRRRPIFFPNLRPPVRPPVPRPPIHPPIPRPPVRPPKPRPSRSPSKPELPEFNLNLEFFITEEENGHGNGESTLCSAPLCTLLLALLPVLLLK